jgi:hypothetical protein
MADCKFITCKRLKINAMFDSKKIFLVKNPKHEKHEWKKLLNRPSPRPKSEKADMVEKAWCP